MSGFRGRTAVVTGGASGLGRALAGLFASEGMRVVIGDIDGGAAERTAQTLSNSGAEAIGLSANVGDFRSLESLAEGALERFGGCDVLAANVGVQRIARFTDMTREEFAWIIATNVTGTADTVRAFLPVLRASTDAHVLVTCSVSSLVTTPGLVGYATSKMGALGLAEGLRAELARENIGVTAMLPGGMGTTHLASSDRARPAHLGEAGTTDPEVLRDVAGMLSPTADAILSPEVAVRNVMAALRENRPYLVTHGPIPDEFEGRVTDLRAAIGRCDEGLFD
jgi:NAD(P)-dependent dehydrogenase (short-subunit alcohol dehydrogenase family)